MLNACSQLTSLWDGDKVLCPCICRSPLAIIIHCWIHISTVKGEAGRQVTRSKFRELRIDSRYSILKRSLIFFCLTWSGQTKNSTQQKLASWRMHTEYLGGKGLLITRWHDQCRSMHTVGCLGGCHSLPESWMFLCGLECPSGTLDRKGPGA